MVPYKAIIYGMEEIGIIDEKSRKYLEKIEKETSDIIEHYIKEGELPESESDSLSKENGGAGEGAYCGRRESDL